MVLNCEQIRNLEQNAVYAGSSYLALMEQAGAGATDWILEKQPGLQNAAILCGKGNNGGDGFVIARRLWRAGVSVTVILLEGEPVTEDALCNFRRLREIAVMVCTYDSADAADAVERAEALVDAVYGIGFHGALREAFIPFFETVNRAQGKRFAVDLPSGVQCDTGKVEGIAFKADYTISFSALKPSQVLYPSAEFCGEIQVTQVGIPEKLLLVSPRLMEETSLSMVKASLTVRKGSAHKGSFGRLLCVCGSAGMAGAAILSASAAVRCGAGIVHACLPKSIYPIVASKVTEPVYTLCQETEEGLLAAEAVQSILHAAENASACLIGCGMGDSGDTWAVTKALLQQTKIPVVVDADGINTLSRHIDVLKTAHAQMIVTPHPGEMARLLGITTVQVQENRLETVRAFAKAYQAVVVLKGSNTLIALPEGEVFVNRTGNPGMAKGGSGDVLAGMIAAFAAQGIPAAKAALCGVYLHGLAGDRCAAKYSQTAMTPSDMLCELAPLFLEIGR